MLDVTWQSPYSFTLADRSGSLLARLEPREAPGRQATEAFIGARFALEHGARISHFLPLLLALRDAEGVLQAAVGIRSALDQSLFLERYLPQPVETQVAVALGRDRKSVV